MTVFTVQCLYPARCFLDKNAKLLSSSKQLPSVYMQLSLQGKPRGQNAASICWFGSVQNFLDQILRADAANEQLGLHCLFFFSLGGASAKACY